MTFQIGHLLGSTLSWKTLLSRL